VGCGVTGDAVKVEVLHRVQIFWRASMKGKAKKASFSTKKKLADQKAKGLKKQRSYTWL